ncbi:glycosyltransferase family 48 protein [[Candida] arabinofermentans NRRL YB-2248]|uniref:1,3-beta-glucan synthase n=1 Tax=[Candida] arabinofermentans NRRL YB-2248 TaxID=983967 RepID=A0A1E4T8G3_9ASCO|nr:glycosyltransferase family 48 protein [[Candida] arabinofermentans NRRL YB-2248]
MAYNKQLDLLSDGLSDDDASSVSSQDYKGFDEKSKLQQNGKEPEVASVLSPAHRNGVSGSNTPILNSAWSAKTTQPFSAFKTPFITTSRWNNIDLLGDVFGVKKFAEAELKGVNLGEKGITDLYDNYYDQYEAWELSEDAPISKQRIQSIFIHLSKIFGFQYDNTKNMFDYLMRLLDSRASRMGPVNSLRSLHADYIGGVNANYRKWYFGCQMDIDDTIGFAGKNVNERSVPLQESQDRWTETMNSFLAEDCIIQLALYLLVWGEANNIRFMPECLCFIFKCCVDIFYSLDFSKEIEPITTSFLDHAITPLYNFYRDQMYSKIDEKWIQRDMDHSKTIGYDDMNQLFWYRKGLEKIALSNKERLMNHLPCDRYLHLNDVVWTKAFSKTYMEYRTWLHMLVNFNRIWNIHVGVFWYYTCFNSGVFYTRDYSIAIDNKPTLTATLSALSIAGSIVCFINLFSLIGEGVFVPRSWKGAQSIFPRFLIVFILLAANLLPSIYIFVFVGLTDEDPLNLGIAAAQFALSVITVIYMSVVPLASLAGNRRSEKVRKYLPTKYFTNSYYELTGKSALASYSLWAGVFVSKFTESYFFLTLSLRDPVRELSILKLQRCTGEAFIGSLICERQADLVLALLLITNLLLFLLDTYLWYIIWNTGFSICRSFYFGVSIWTPWRNMFIRLPKRIISKILSQRSISNSNAKTRKVMISQVWNSIVLSMYREHLLSLEHLQGLIYQRTTSVDGSQVLTEPRFFLDQEDGESPTRSESDLDPSSEASRRLSFFAHSLSTPMPNPDPIEEMPTFSVLIPHYAEKITLSLQEIIKKEDEYSNVTLLEYLKQLYPQEWHNFVRDTKLMAEESDAYPSDAAKDAINDLPFYSVGFKAATPEYILRTRIWASLRSQTLYRTISGFMNYSRALKLLYVAENNQQGDDSLKMEEASALGQRKFRIVVSLQRMNDFTREQDECREFLMRTYPELQVAYIDSSIDPETNEKEYYSCLIDGTCDILENGKRKPKYRIKLSGNPILGDGKSDNQNHALVFCRGEYIQLIDANQDNYLEECIKIRSVLSEFEEKSPLSNPYGIPASTPQSSLATLKHPVAIIGTREYIFSENIGVLGDIAAGKEQTFGTLFARTLAQVGGKLHYGHPDFLNSVFMTTRGGVSKSQKGLHLNEDIYAGMTAILRGGRIKHCEYFQCGKGRDLGFGSILNFTTKIGAGMGEQMLSREYFYLGANLPLDRFLSFYYAHPGFHLNNVFILLSLKIFVLFCINLAALTNDSILCEYDKDRPITDARGPVGCYNLIPVIDWVQRCILSIFIVFSISFIPLSIQELTERGIFKCFTRLSKHFFSMSPLFEVFVCRIYAQSLVNDLAVGGAKYIATGRGFSTTRVKFSALYSRFSNESIYFANSMFLLLLYCSLVMWKISLLYFWCTVLALSLSPFWFNPNQLQFNEFFIDYREALRWFTSGNAKSKKDSWITHVRTSRMQLTGSKRKKMGRAGDNLASDYKRPSMLAGLCNQVGSRLIVCCVVVTAYLFANSQNEGPGDLPSYTILRLAVVTLCPLVVDAAILVALFPVSLITGPIFSLCFSQFSDLIANFAHLLALINHLVFFEFLLLCQNWDISKSILGACSSFLLQSVIFKALTIVFLSREFKHDRSNRSWWSGKWFTSGLGWHTFTQPSREFICKIIEMSAFACDFTTCHCLLLCQFPLLFIPYIDTFHSYLLLWLKPQNQIRRPVFSPAKRRLRNRITVCYFILFVLVMIIGISLLVCPIILGKVFEFDFEEYLPDKLTILLQPVEPINPRKGLKGYIAPKTHN